MVVRIRRAATTTVALAVLAVAGGASVAAIGDGGTAPEQELNRPAVDKGGASGIDLALAAFVDPSKLAAVPVGPEAVAEPVRAVLRGAPVIDALGQSGIPDVALRAYHGAADRLAVDDPSCGLRWTLLAAIGRVESNHGRFGGTRLRADGFGTMPIRGIPLDGRPNVALIRDTDGGTLDGDTTFDRAVGPMQFIPATWRSVGADADGDGRSDPNSIFDAALGAGRYLCAGDADLRDPAQQARAVFRYNHADEYVQVVLRLAQQYEGGVVPLPTTPPAPAPVGPDPEPRPAPVVVAPPTPSPPASVIPAPVTAPVPEPPPAAVGWAPAMREVVVELIDEPPPDAGTPTSPPATPSTEPEPVPCEPPAPTDPTTPSTTSTTAVPTAAASDALPEAPPPPCLPPAEQAPADPGSTLSPGPPPAPDA